MPLEVLFKQHMNSLIANSDKTLTNFSRFSFTEILIKSYFVCLGGSKDSEHTIHSVTRAIYKSKFPQTWGGNDTWSDGNTLTEIKHKNHTYNFQELPTSKYAANISSDSVNISGANSFF